MLLSREEKEIFERADRLLRQDKLERAPEELTPSERLLAETEQRAQKMAEILREMGGSPRRSKATSYYTLDPVR